MPKKWMVDLKEFEGLLNSNYDTATSLARAGTAPLGPTCEILVLNGIAVGLLAIAERLEVIAEAAVKVSYPLYSGWDLSRKCLCELDFREGKAPGPDHETTCPRYKEVKIGGTDPD